MRATLLSFPLVLLCACHHVGGDFGFLGPKTENPDVQGLARFRDVDGDGEAGPGDVVILSFSRSVTVVDRTAASILLAAERDTFGVGATLVEGPGPREAQVILGQDARLRTRGLGTGQAGINQPSSLRVTGGIDDEETGGTVNISDWLDVVPEMVPGDSTGLADAGLEADGEDLNHDGLVDWAVAAGAEGFDVYEQLAGGGYLRTNFLPGAVSRVRLADLVGQGRRDLVVVTGEGLRTYVNQSSVGGAVSLAENQNLEASFAIRDLQVLDVDGDGDLDLALLADDGVRLVRNDGAGQFDAPEDPLVDSPTDGRALVLADVAGDGHADLIIARDGENVVIANAGCGEFGDASPFEGAGVTDHIVVGDLDGDGDLDAVGGGPDGLQAWRGEGGALTPAPEFFDAVPTEAVSALRLLDLDGDARLEVLFGTADGVRLLAFDVANELVATGMNLDAASAQDLVARDADLDGDLDLLVVSEGGPRLWRGSLTGTWGASRLRPSAGDVGAGPLFSTASADVNGDGFDDLVLGRNSSIEIYENDGNGALEVGQVIDLGISRAHNLVTCDIDQDGDEDLVAAIIGDAPIVWLNDGAGVFEGTTSLGFESATSVGVGDLDGDGDLDVVLGRLEGKPDRILFNAGTACDNQGTWPGFSSVVDLPGEFHTGSLVVGDVDLDGDLDLLFGHGDSTSDRLFLNDGAGSFSLSGQEFGKRATRALLLADLDRDGDPDLVSGNQGADQIWHNDGAGNFTLVAQVSAGSTYDADLADLDGDGVLDLIEGRRYDQGIVVIKGTPDGLFSGGEFRKVVDDDVRKIQFIDIDRDGDPDFVTGMDDGAENRLWLNL